MGDGIHDAASLLECGKDALRIFSQDSRFDGGPQCGAGQGPFQTQKAGT
ncbi:hypothetical protein DESPIGER_2096 [Desulfovibrio piger]|uniref:Uncharacterized protein n=1 Tax=Desulfovibrio piger TaxID=901 RepID=A0A1K1LKB0_9BACT|nr:hypothetical protein DESPIGER_2096 [Desulfovibrio piger]